MKITIAYLPAEEEKAMRLMDLVCAECKNAKINKSALHPPFKHIYLSTKKPENPCGARDSS